MHLSQRRAIQWMCSWWCFEEPKATDKRKCTDTATTPRNRAREIVSFCYTAALHIRPISPTKKAVLQCRFHSSASVRLVRVRAAQEWYIVSQSIKLYKKYTFLFRIFGSVCDVYTGTALGCARKQATFSMNAVWLDVVLCCPIHVYAWPLSHPTYSIKCDMLTQCPFSLRSLRFSLCCCLRVCIH